MKQIIPFNGDRLIGEEIKRLIQQFHIRTIVETGAWSCHSTRAFREMLPKGGRVITIDITADHLTEEFGDKALDDVRSLGIEFIVGDSGVELPKLLNRIEHPALFYLDAHGQTQPRSEILALSANKKTRGNCVLAIHDFEVPGALWGYNWVHFEGQEAGPLNMAVIEPWIKDLYPRGYRFHYNDRAEGCQRGIVYIYPTDVRSEIAKLNGKPLGDRAIGAGSGAGAGHFAPCRTRPKSYCAQ